MVTMSLLISPQDVNLREGLGQKFKAFLKGNPDQDKLYNSTTGAVGSRDMKKQFRLRWAQTQLNAVTKVIRSKRECLEEQMGEQGVYLAFDRIVIEEGGFQSLGAIQRAVAYTRNAMKAGFPFIEYNAWKEATEILYFRKVRNSVFSNRWTLERSEEQVANGA